MMATLVSEGIVHTFAGNPKMEGDDWKEEFPPIVTEAKLLRNKATGQIFGKTEDLCYRSDIMEPYFGKMTDADNGPAPSKTTPQIEQVFDQLPAL